MFENYEVDGLFDEVFASQGSPRRHYSPLVSRLSGLGVSGLRKAAADDRCSLPQSGDYFHRLQRHARRGKIFPFDLVPRIVPAEEWDVIERGLGSAHHGAQYVLP